MHVQDMSHIGHLDLPWGVEFKKVVCLKSDV